ncbi:MAG: DUF1016 family protein [Desulfobacterales bacterium]|nr:DUF1016 family protein [Desulfobacterales bacterium]
MTENLIFYSTLLTEIKNRIHQAQTKAILAANAEMIDMYWDIGRIILAKQQQEGWGAGVIPRLSRDLRNELPEVKGFSERNIGYMIRFAKEYNNFQILQQPVAKFERQGDVSLIKHLIPQIPWGHNILLIEKIKEVPIRLWYMQEILKNGWSRDILALMIKNNTHARQATLASNFKATLPEPQSDLVRQTLKDPYIFDFITMAGPFQERELETELVKHLEKFLIELGSGFAFVGRQYKLTVANQDFYLDLLFYHIKLRCFIIVDLKKGDFKPEYAGKMNFYCSAVDDLLRHHNDQPTIGLILCQTKNKIFAEYALRDINKPIGISEYELTRSLPVNLKPSLPSIEDIEKELEGNLE